MTIAFLQQLLSSYKSKELYGRYISFSHIEPLIENHKEHFNIDVVGRSVLKQPIHRIILGHGSTKILLWSQMHGNESTTTKAIFDVLNVFKSSKEEDIHSILTSCTIVILPMLNPDGANMYTRNNANDIDLNRDAQALTQPESKVLRAVFDEFKPNFCFNLHGQRSIFSVGNVNKSAILSFLAPAQDTDFSVSINRKIAMDLISRVQDALQIIITNQIGIYDDSFNIDCVGDTFQSLGVPTLLFEAGHFPEDYQRETTRELIFMTLLLAFNLISDTTDLGVHHKFYFQIPQNEKLFRDIIIRNVLLEDKIVDIAIQYKEELKNDLIEFSPIIDTIEASLNFYGHREINAHFNMIESPKSLVVGNEIVFVSINNEKFSLLA